MATYVISDIHGQYNMFIELLDKINLKDTDTLYILGDVLDRGPHPIKTIRYDIIVGYRADDSYFSFAQDFVLGVISLEKLSEAMRLGKLGEQIVLKSPKAFETIYFQNYENVDAEIYYIKKAEREREARREYRRRKKESADIHELFMLDIMREGMENGDTRLFR